MKTFNSLVADFTTLSNDASGTVLGKTLINFAIKKILSLSDWTFNKEFKSISAGTSIQYYQSPYNASKIDYLTVTFGGLTYTPSEIRSTEIWNRLNWVKVSSDIPQFWYFKENTKETGIFPVPASGSPQIKIYFTKKSRDLSVADYSTGSVSASAGGTVFQMTGGTWNTLMAGRVITVSQTNTPIDGFPFEIISVSGGSAAYVKESIPNAVSSGTYTIAEPIPLPDGFEDLPLWYALNQYYQMKEKPVLAREYKTMYVEGISDLMRRDIKTTNQVMTKQSGIRPIDPNTNPWYIGTIS